MKLSPPAFKVPLEYT